MVDIFAQVVTEPALAIKSIKTRAVCRVDITTLFHENRFCRLNRYGGKFHNTVMHLFYVIICVMNRFFDHYMNT